MLSSHARESKYRRRRNLPPRITTDYNNILRRTQVQLLSATPNMGVALSSCQTCCASSPHILNISTISSELSSPSVTHVCSSCSNDVDFSIRLRVKCRFRLECRFVYNRSVTILCSSPLHGLSTTDMVASASITCSDLQL